MKRIFTLRFTVSFLLIYFCGIGMSQTYTFTNCGATGQNGPSGAAITAEYDGTTLEGLVTGVAGIQYWTVPATGDYSIEVFGAQGGDDGGLGARMYGEFALTAGQELKILVGQEGSSGNAIHGSGGGGTFVVLADGDVPLIVAGGGGGHGAGVPGLTAESDGSILTAGVTPGAGAPGGIDGGGGGAGASSIGGTAVTPGGDSPSSVWASGGGGFLTKGGACTTGTVPGGRAFVDGGQGGDEAGTSFSEGGFGGGGGAGDRGAGGGGYSGGGAGTNNNDGGGGGGSYNDGVNQDNEAGFNTGHGSVIITTLCDALTLTVSDYDPCIDQFITLEVESEAGGIITWEDGVEDGVPFIPGGPGEYTYIATSSIDEDCSAEIHITVHGLPEIVANAAPSEVCEGGALLLYGSGGLVYEWDPGTVEDGVAFYPEPGSLIYTVVGADEFGCVNLDEVEVVVHALPSVGIDADKTNICAGGEVTLSGTGAETYEWDMGVSDGESFIIDDVGTTIFEVTGIDENGCENTAEITINVNEQITITSTTTEELFGDDGAIDITVTGGFPPYSFDWDNDGTGDFDDAEDLTDISGGTYIVVLEGSEDCMGSDTITVGSQLSIAENSGLQVSLYPNPTSAICQLELAGNFAYTLSNLSGQILFTRQATDKSMIDLSNFADGIYFVDIIQGKEAHKIKLIKQ
jgi:hypothetical protein